MLNITYADMFKATPKLALEGMRNLGNAAAGKLVGAKNWAVSKAPDLGLTERFHNTVKAYKEMKPETTDKISIALGPIVGPATVASNLFKCARDSFNVLSTKYQLYTANKKAEKQQAEHGQGSVSDELIINIANLKLARDEKMGQLKQEAKFIGRGLLRTIPVIGALSIVLYNKYSS